MHITDSCCETVTCQEMKATTDMDDSFCQHLENMITSDGEVLFCWTMITADESYDSIFHELITLWITIRGSSHSIHLKNTRVIFHTYTTFKYPTVT